MPEVRGTFMLLHGRSRTWSLRPSRRGSAATSAADKGVLVVRAPADGALKLEDGDVILAIDGREPTSGSHATRILGSYQPGEKITLRIVRQTRSTRRSRELPAHGRVATGDSHRHRDLSMPPMPPEPPLPQAAPVPPARPQAGVVLRDEA